MTSLTNAFPFHFPTGMECVNCNFGLLYKTIASIQVFHSRFCLASTVSQMVTVYPATNDDGKSTLPVTLLLS